MLAETDVLACQQAAVTNKNRGAQAFYKFVCLHCGTVLLGWDCS